MTSKQIRNHFLEFFRARQHIIVPSAPIVVKNDPTLMFTNAGMNQFKDYFLGTTIPPYKRVANTQKCLRVSGKHNDLEEVGVDSYHHTMFEMLGNWSFNDYFKKEAIAWSWELLTEVYKIPKDLLYVTVFEGDEAEKLPEDVETRNEWKKWISADRILSFGKKDNFWEMGETGPCGPCTEIHMDCRKENERKEMNGRDLVNKEHPGVIEIWNNVFIQYNRLKEGILEPLPAKHVDTGMGLERLTRVLQKKDSNYDTDIFSELIHKVEHITGIKYTGSKSKADIAFRVVADHIRAICFTIADGQLPSNTGAGYVIRRILRRATRYYFTYLDFKLPLLFQLIPDLSEQFKDVFPELNEQKAFIMRVIREEEESFMRTLERGLKKIDELVHAEKSRRTIKGADAFELYDTYGFPLDLTRLIALENNYDVDESGFEHSMLEQKNRSRSATAIDTEDWVILKPNATVEFVGYGELSVETKVTRYRKIRAKGKEAVQIVLEKTPFYPESGGQVGDVGKMSFEGEFVEIYDTKKENELIIHYTEKLPVNITGVVSAQVDADRRKKTAIHHSATHLLHAALRSVLGSHVLQKGSLVNAEHLRFDFSHMAKLVNEEIISIERIVNEKIRQNIPVVIKHMPREEALAMGAMALFGEKYGDVVRVVIIDQSYSVELCGGTHVGATGELGIFKILQESAIAAGVRRIEAVSGPASEKHIEEVVSINRAVSQLLKNPKDVLKSIESLLTENAMIKKQLEKSEDQHLVQLEKDLLTQVKAVNGINFIGEIIEVSNADSLKKICLQLKNQLDNYAIVLAAKIDGKPQVALLLDEKVATKKNVEASKIVKEQIAPLIKGGGGGQKTLATAGGQDASQLETVIEKVRSLLK